MVVLQVAHRGIEMMVQLGFFFCFFFGGGGEERGDDQEARFGTENLVARQSV